MADVVKWDVKGLTQLQRKLNNLAANISHEGGAALRMEGEIEMTEAKRRTPVKTGALRGSGTVTGPQFRGKVIQVRLKFGNFAVSYAARVHEDTEVFHRVGQAKFLESVILESAPYMAARVAKRISLIRAAK